MAETKITLYPDDAVILAPLSGYTDLPFRRSCRRHGCYYAFTEMIDTGALLYANRHARRYLERGSDEPWLGVQLVGAGPTALREAARMLNDYDFDVLDFNLGCPVAKVAGKGKGAGLARDMDAAAEALAAIVAVSRFPVTAKFRVQDESSPASTIALARKLEEAGAVAMTLHGRTAARVYGGPCHGDIIRATREAVKTPIVANGGVRDPDSYAALLGEAGPGPTMVARGAMGNPWIFEILSGRRRTPPEPEALREEMSSHIGELFESYGEELGAKICRKYLLDYLRGRGYPKALKVQASSVSGKDAFRRFLDAFSAALVASAPTP